MTAVLGLAPYLSSARPRDPARWWSAAGPLEGDRLVASLAESDAPPEIVGTCGLAAPCSLPAPFLDFLGVRRSLDALGPPDRLFRRAREFAAAAPRGQKHPLRFAHESLPALDRRRLPLFLAAVPLLRGDAARFLVEVDVPATLRAAGLPHAQLGGAIPAAVDRRARVLAGLADGVLGLKVEAAQRDYAVASFHALAALVACAMAARVQVRGDRRPADAEAWVPLP
jgi:hypothetical protein